MRDIPYGSSLAASSDPKAIQVALAGLHDRRSIQPMVIDIRNLVCPLSWPSRSWSFSAITDVASNTFKVTGFRDYRSTASVASSYTSGTCKPLTLTVRQRTHTHTTGVSFLFAVINFLMLGSVGFLASYFVVHRLYSSIRVE